MSWFWTNFVPYACGRHELCGLYAGACSHTRQNDH